MMDLDESLRALYFAPLPMIVLDSNRNVRLCNRPAEILLSVTAPNIVGQRLDKFVTSATRSQLVVALNEASAKSDRTKWSAPIDTRLTLLTGDEQRTQQADLSVSAWSSTANMFESQVEGKEGSAGSPPVQRSASTPDATRRTSSMGGGGGGPLLHHESLYTISLVPTSRRSDRKMSPVEEQKSKIDKLSEAIVWTLDEAVMALSKDGTALIRNRACEEALSKFKRQDPKTKNESGEDAAMDDPDGLAIDLSWLSMNMNCYDEFFEKRWGENAWPIYRSAVKGERVPAVFMGCEVPETGERVIFEIAGKPMRDSGGFGEHIGGLVTIRDVTTERTERRQEIQAQGDAYFKQTCDSLPQLVWVTTPTGFHEWYSKSWYDYTGAMQHETFGAGWQDCFHPEDLPESGRRWSHSLRTGEQYETAYRCRRHDGAWRWMLGRAQPLRDARTGDIVKWFGTCTDIHDQVEALSASRQAQSQLESVINQAAMTLWAVDREGIVTVAEGPGVRQLKLMTPGTPIGSEKDASNASMLRDDRAYSEDGGMHNSGSNSNSNSNSGSGSRQRHTMIGRSIYHVWDSVDIRKAIQRALEGESITEEMEIDGRWFRTSYNPLRASYAQPETLAATENGETAEDAEIIGVVGASMDITERKRAQIQMEESLVEKSRALAAEGAAREASRLKSEFLANMSHEIRTPIAGVIGLSELLLDEKLTPQQRDYAETIQRSAEGLLTVINDVLDFSKVEIGKLDVEKAPFSLEVVLRDQKRMLSFATQKKGLEFRDSVDLRYKGLLIGDAGRLRQVITNILTNAIKFTAVGYISMDVAEVSEDENSVTVKVDIRDTGCGIAPETLSRLFQPFSQADPSTARRFGGTGLGLSISKNLVELMHGEIGLNSVEGQGSHAWFVVPFAKAGKSAQVQALNQSAAQPNLVGASGGMPGLERNALSLPRKDIWILIAEDNLVNAQIASKNLKKMGFSCRTAENGRLALEELHSGKTFYSCVLMDCMMPECDGYEATRLIRKSANPDIRMLPVIALTASAIKGDRERAIEAGMVDYLAKPVKRPALEATLCRWLFDDEARQALSRFTLPPAADASAPPTAIASGSMTLETPGTAAADSGSAYSPLRPPNVRQDMAVSPKTVEKAPNPRTEYPFPTPNQSASMTRTASASSTTPTLKSQGQRTLKVNTSDALGAAAALLAERRASDESPALTVERFVSRPKMSPRAKSHTYSPAVAVGGVGPVRATRGQSHPATFMVRRSSREQGGMGRDLQGELMNAAGLESEPRLGTAMEGGERDEAEAEAAADADARADDKDADGDSPMAS